jgi:hypothetical protein
VKFYGSGHVVAHNRVENFHDGIDHATYGMPEGYPELDRNRAPVSNDIYQNDISNAHDNCIEADGGISNIRVFRNRCTNTAAGSFSTQPALGGPIYFVRNVVYHSPETGPITLPNNSAGVVFYNNTFIANVTPNTPAANLHFRNNLIVATTSQRPVLAIRTYTAYSSLDYNGYALPSGLEKAFAWTAPGEGVSAVYDPKALVERTAASLGVFRKATGQERNGRVLDAGSLFEHLTLPGPDDPYKVYARDAARYSLKKGSGAIDRGTHLPTLTDGYTGRAPDLGAVEFGQPEPRYGPRI